MKIYKISKISLVFGGILYSFAVFGAIALIYTGLVDKSWIFLPIPVAIVIIFGSLVLNDLNNPIKIILDGNKAMFKSLISTTSVNIHDISEIQSSTVRSIFVKMLFGPGSSAQTSQIYYADKKMINLTDSIPHLDDFIRELKKINPNIKIVEKNIDDYEENRFSDMK